MKTSNLLKCALIGILTSVSPAVLAESYRSVLVTKTDGTYFIVAGEKNLTAKFADNDMTFAVGDNVIISLPVEDVKGWELSEESNVKEFNSDYAITCKYEEGALTLTGLGNKSIVRMTDISGVVISEATASESYTIDVSHLFSGIYVLSCKEKSFKIHIKQ